MVLDFITWNDLMYLIGEAAVIIVIGALLTAFILVIISIYSIRKGRLYFPTLVRSGPRIPRRPDEGVLPASWS